MLHVFQWIFLSVFRPIFKWFLHQTTGLCELQRICYGQIGVDRIRGVELSLERSRTPKIRKLMVELDELVVKQRFDIEKRGEAVRIVMRVKKIKPEIHFRFVEGFDSCLKAIWGFKQVLNEVELLRMTQYCVDNISHEEKLMKLWKNLMDEALEARQTKQWQLIGFQGDDPATDFRGMGMLGLENLLYFTLSYNAAAKHVLQHSQHPKYGYCFAIVGINLTSMALNFFKHGEAKNYFYTKCAKSAANVELFHQFYCYLFYEFDRFWIDAKPENIMQFSTIRSNFERNMRTLLEDTDVDFRMNLAVDDV